MDFQRVDNNKRHRKPNRFDVFQENKKRGTTPEMKAMSPAPEEVQSSPLPSNQETNVPTKVVQTKRELDSEKSIKEQKKQKKKQENAVTRNEEEKEIPRMGDIIEKGFRNDSGVQAIIQPKKQRKTWFSVQELLNQPAIGEGGESSW